MPEETEQGQACRVRTHSARTLRPREAEVVQVKRTAACCDGPSWDAGVIVMRWLERAILSVFASAVIASLCGVAPAFAGPSPWWSLTSGSWPTNLAENGSGKLVVTAENMGEASVEGSVTPVVVEDVVPEHVTVTGVEGVAGESTKNPRNRGPVVCASPSARVARCVFEGSLPPYEELEVRVAVTTAGAKTGEGNTVTISGGGERTATLTKPIDVGTGNQFGVADYELNPEEEGGAMDTQAGSHPFQLTTVLALDTSRAPADFEEQEPASMVKDLSFQLPAGLVGNPTPFPQCTDVQFSTHEPGTEHNECEAKTAIGVATVTFNVSKAEGFTSRTVPVFNLPPLAGEPARFGFEVTGARTFIDTAVRSGGDYGVTVSVSNVSQTIGFLSSKVTLWGVPGAGVHDSRRGWECLEERQSSCSADVSKPPPFVSLPTSCTGPLHTTVQADSWEDPHPSLAQLGERPLFDEDTLAGLGGCNQLQFNPGISVVPDVPEASTATGVNVRIHVPQTAALNPEGLAESDVKDITVALPPGVAVNPGGADGLQACSEGLVGFTGFSALDTGGSLATFTSDLPEPLEQGVNFCPDASKIGEVTVKTPLLPAGQFVKGYVYLASQNANPFGSLIALYLVAKDPISGTVVKLAGETQLCPGPGATIDGMACQATGQIVTTFLNSPQLAFEDAELHFFGEARAPLGTPPFCGSYTTHAVLAPWSGSESSPVSSTFDITTGPKGAPCHDRLPFAPSLTAGSINNQAGAFSSFTTTLSREDGNQNLESVQLHMPAGLSGVLSGVALCGEAQADAGTCGEGSLIGETTVSVGLGGNPYTVTGGRVYLTGSYEGAPFGLSIVTPAKAGPFDLGQVVVRAKIDVDPHTAALTVTTDNSGPYTIPSTLQGIPLQIQHVNVTIGRSGFTFNPTNCSPLQIAGTLSSVEGASSSLRVPFQVANCAALQFAPKFNVATSGKTSKANGASLAVKLAYPNAPQGSQTNIASVKVELPKQLPSRLTTLQKACTAAQFDTNPAGCPVASIIGQARATTPILPVPLEGPAYFVSHGGEAFPSLIVVLEGYGVTVDLVGTTFISKAGITSSTFKTVPDVPVGTFELTLPQGPYSALAANGDLCTSKLAMPTEFVAQNGAAIHESTKIAVTGCPKVKKPTRAQLLAGALKACRKKARGHRRAVCEARARKRYGPVKKAKKGAVRKRK